MGGPVRLQQVIVNLMTNAVDAMGGMAEKSLRLSLDETGETVALRVADTGPGLEAPDRVFEPFYTTKDIGASKGLGYLMLLANGRAKTDLMFAAMLTLGVFSVLLHLAVRKATTENQQAVRHQDASRFIRSTQNWRPRKRHNQRLTGQE